MVEKHAKRLPESLDIGEQDRLLVTAELGPGDLLDEFFQGSHASGQRDKGVRALEHNAFSLMHIAGDDALLRALHHMLAVDQEIRNDAGDEAAVIEH